MFTAANLSVLFGLLYGNQNEIYEKEIGSKLVFNFLEVDLGRLNALALLIKFVVYTKVT